MNQEVKALRSELALLKLQFSEKVNDVEARLNILIESDALQKSRQEQSFTDIEDDYSELSQTHSETQIQTEAPTREALLSVSSDEFLTVEMQAREPQISC